MAAINHGRLDRYPPQGARLPPEALATANGDRRAAAIVAAALTNDDLVLRYYEPGSIFGAGVLGSFDRASQLVNVAKGQDPLDELVVIAHEIGH